MNALEALFRAEAAVFLLEAVRLSAVVIVAPLPWSNVPVRLRAGLVLVLALAAHGQAYAPVEATGSVVGLMLAVASEFVVGAAIGLVVRIAVSIAEIATNSMAPLMGFGMAQVFDPQAHSSQAVLTPLLRNLAVLLALIIGLHRVLIGSVLASFRVLPPGTLASPGQAAPTFVALTAGAIESGVRIAIPILGVLFMTQLALAFISRAAPAMQIFSVGFAVTLAVGVVVLILVLPDMARELTTEMSQVGTQIERVLLVLAVHGT